MLPAAGRTPATQQAATAAPAPAPATANTKNGKGNNAKGAAPAPGGGFQRAEAQATASAPPPTDTAAPASPDATQSAADLSQRASDGYLVNGSQVNGASSNFGLNPAIGNNRRGPRSLYNGSIGFINFGNSNLNARPYSITGQDTPKPESTTFTGIGSFGGPLRIPHLLRNGPAYTISYQWTRNRTATTTPALMPTKEQTQRRLLSKREPAHRAARSDFRSLHRLALRGQYDPVDPSKPSGAGSLRISYPLPNLVGNPSYNYQVPLITPSHIDAMQSRANKPLGRKNFLNGGFGFQSVRTDNPSVLGFPTPRRRRKCRPIFPGGIHTPRDSTGRSPTLSAASPFGIYRFSRTG